MGNSLDIDLDKCNHIDHKIAIVDNIGKGMSCKVKLGIDKETG